VQDPFAQVLRHSREGVGVELRTILFDLQDLGFEFLAESFVGIDGQHPIAGGLLGGIVLLTRVTVPAGLDGACAVVLGDLDGTVAGAAVHHQDLVATAQALDGAREITFLVERDDGRRDLQLGTQASDRMHAKPHGGSG